MSSELFLHDSYQKENDAIVIAVVDEKFVVLNQTVFYPQGGGQPGDTGILKRGKEEFIIVNTIKKESKILHEVDRIGLATGDYVHATIDWERRYAHMRHHTAAHLLSAIVHDHSGALITGNQIGADKLRIDFALDAYDPLKMQHYVDIANEIVAKHLDIHVRFLPRDEALQLPGVVKLAGALPPNIPELRIVSIGAGADLADEQADGGTHVHNTKEIGVLKLERAENKGKNNRRISVVLDSA